jgi:hypothetical protein
MYTMLAHQLVLHVMDHKHKDGPHHMLETINGIALAHVVE